jgi:Domain of unknown function (DU1801)
MPSPKTRPSDGSAEAFIAAVPDDARREDAQKLRGLLADWTGEAPALWGTSIVGFGCYRYRYDSGHQGTAALVGFSPLEAHLVVYLVGRVQGRYRKLLHELGPHKVGKGCLYLKRLDDVDHDVLQALVKRTVRVHRGADNRASAGT